MGQEQKVTALSWIKPAPSHMTGRHQVWLELSNRAAKKQCDYHYDKNMRHYCFNACWIAAIEDLKSLLALQEGSDTGNRWEKHLDEFLAEANKPQNHLAPAYNAIKYARRIS